MKVETVNTGGIKYEQSYQHWWDKLWMVPTINTGGIKYEQYKHSILVG